MSQTKSIKKTVPFAMMVTVGFFIAGFVSYALFNALTSAVWPAAYENNWTIIFGWIGVWVTVGVLFGIYYGRK